MVVGEVGEVGCKEMDDVELCSEWRIPRWFQLLVNFGDVLQLQ